MRKYLLIATVIALTLKFSFAEEKKTPADYYLYLAPNYGALSYRQGIYQGAKTAESYLWPEKAQLQQELKDEYDRFLSDKMDWRTWNNVLNGVDDKIKDAKLSEIYRENTKELIKAPIGILFDFASGSATKALGSNVAGKAFLSELKNRSSAEISEALVNTIPYYSREVQEQERKNLAALIIAKYKVKHQTTALDLKLSENAVPAVIREVFDERFYKGLSEKAHLINQDNLAKRFVEAPADEKDTFLFQMISELKEELKPKDGGSESPQSVSEQVIDQQLSLHILKAYAKDQLLKVNNELAQSAKKMTIEEHSRLESAQSMLSAFAKTGDSTFLSLNEMLNLRKEIVTGSSQEQASLDFVIDQMSPEQRYAAHEAGIRIIRDPSELKKLKNVVEAQRMERNVHLAASYANSAVQLAYALGSLSAEEAQKVQGAISMIEGAATAIAGIYSANPGAVAAGVSSFVGGISALSAKKDNTAEAWKALFAMLDEIIRMQKALMEQNKALHRDLINKHQEVMKKLDEEFGVLKWGVSGFLARDTDKTEREYYSSCYLLRVYMEENYADLSKDTKGIMDPEFMDRSFMSSSKSKVLSRWSNCFKKLRELMVGPDSDSVPDFFRNVSERNSNMVSGMEKAYREDRIYRELIGRFRETYQNFSQKGVIPGLLLYSDSAEKLNIKNASLVDLKAAASEESFFYKNYERLLSAENLRLFVQQIKLAYPFSFYVNEESDDVFTYSPLSDHIVQMKDLHDSKKSFQLKKYVGPGSSSEFFSMVKKAERIIKLAIAQRRILEGDLFLKPLWESINNSLSLAGNQFAEKPDDRFTYNDEYRAFIKLLNENRFLASNLLTYAFLSEIAQSGISKDLALLRYRQAYDSGSRNALEVFLKEYTRLDHSLIDSYDLTILCNSDHEVMYKTEKLNSEIFALQEKIFANGFTKDSLMATDDVKQVDSKRALINELSFAAQKDRHCNVSSNIGNRWFLRLPLGQSFIPIPRPEDLENAGTFIMSEDLQSLLQSQKEIGEILNDMQLPSLMTDKELPAIEKIYPR